MPDPLRNFRIWLILCLVGIAGCGDGGTAAPSAPSANGDSKTSAGKPRIVTTVGMVTDIVREVVGDHGEVIGLLNEGVDPHLYKPTREDVKQLSEANVIFYGGLMLEGRMEESLKKLRAGKPVVGVAESLDKGILRKPPEFDGHFDPHVWMDVKLWSQCVDAVTKTMREFDAVHADEFASRAEAYQQKLAKLDEYVRQSIASIPEKQRVLVTAHDAFGYFARAYDMEVKSVQGISTESEAGVADVNALVDFLVGNKIGAIFVESSVSDKSLRAVIEGAEKRGWTVKVGGELFSDAMGAPGTYEGTYMGMIDHNATTITRALGGQAPEGGFRSTLEQP
jgi:manganese/zinc/iron transport system substrate-binding protein